MNVENNVFQNKNSDNKSLLNEIKNFDNDINEILKNWSINSKNSEYNIKNVSKNYK